MAMNCWTSNHEKRTKTAQKESKEKAPNARKKAKKKNYTL